MTYAAQNPGVKAYAKSEEAQRPTADSDPREIEAWGLMRAATELQNAVRNLEDRKTARWALQQNMRLWTILQAGVTEAENPLDDDVKQNILRLSLYVDEQSMSAMSDLDAERIQELISINIQIAAGLRGRTAEGNQAGQSNQGAGKRAAQGYGGGQQPRQRVTISA